MHLTFSWGTTVSRSALVSLVHTSKRTLDTIIRDGHSAWALAPGFGYFIVPKHGLLLVARPYQEEDFTYQQIYEAVDLLQLCGPDRGFRDEMWAYVFVEEARVGYNHQLLTIEMNRGNPRGRAGERGRCRRAAPHNAQPRANRLTQPTFINGWHSVWGAHPPVGVSVRALTPNQLHTLLVTTVFVRQSPWRYQRLRDAVNDVAGNGARPITGAVFAAMDANRIRTDFPCDGAGGMQERFWVGRFV
ncbi:MAG: hypothetical protein Q9177_000903 [Variospora cf. flavescens]